MKFGFQYIYVYIYIYIYRERVRIREELKTIYRGFTDQIIRIIMTYIYKSDKR